MEKLEQLLIQQGGISAKVIEAAKDKSKKEKITFLHALELLNAAPEGTLLKIFASFYNVQIATLQDMEIPKNIINLISHEIAEKSRLIPIDRAGNNIIVAIGDPKNSQAEISIKYSLGYSIKPVLASEKQITAALAKYYPKKKNLREFKKKDLQAFENTMKKTDSKDSNQRISISSKKSSAGGADGPIVSLVNDILIQCVDKGGSDIHIEPYENNFRIRLRVDGVLLTIATPPVQIKDALTTRIKILAKLDIAEKRLPQDGGIRVEIHDRPIDFRVNTLPTIYGEKIVLRLLDKSALNVDMTALGFEIDDLEKFMDAIHRPYGMVLVTGPTGSGKTTTLYSALSELNKDTENIMTAEDPVEYNLEGINQVQMKSDIGLDFAAALRAFLRQDPDIIMVGEIRDLETAEIAIKAALTGHLVLSTLHTNSATETIVRLQQMGVEPFNIASSLNAIVAQRLGKRICTKCRVVDDLVGPEAMVNLGIHPSFADKVKAYKGQGCEECNNNGTKGRTAIHEVLLVNDAVRESILRGDSALDLKKIAMANGMRTLRQAALNKMAQGILSMHEVGAVSSSDSSKQDEKRSVA